MEKYNPEENFESNESVEKEYGANVEIDIELIRHPEKNPETGDITEKGKEEFLNKLEGNYDSEYEVYKFYLSPHKRPQQTRETIQKFLDEKNIKTKIRDKKELLGGFSEKEGETSYEPKSEEDEKMGNKLMIEKFFDEYVPETDIKGENIGLEIKELVDHFRKLASRLRSNSKVKIILVGHSGIIEHY